MNWFDTLPPAVNLVQYKRALKGAITAQNYGRGSDEWNLTQVLTILDGSLSVHVKRILSGEVDGTTIPGAGIKGDDGNDRVFTLQVLTRQACCRDKDGNELTPSDFDVKDPPLEGDIIEIKSMRRSPDNGVVASADEFRLWEIQGKRRHEYREYAVDSKGCIHVGYADAIRMLQRAGHRIVSARHRTEKPTRDQIEFWNATGEGPKPRTRVIANWHFKEIIDASDMEQSKVKPKRTRAKAKAKQTEANDNPPTAE